MSYGQMVHIGAGAGSDLAKLGRYGHGQGIKENKILFSNVSVCIDRVEVVEKEATEN
jgi:hypothetical protein